MPPPITLPSVVRSGRTPYSAWAPPGATRNPVITSSKMSTAPCSSQHSRSASRKPGTGGTQFMFPATGSTITPAIRSPSFANASRTPPVSLKARVSVCSASAAGTPGEVGTPNVSAPEPAFTSSESPCPW